MPGFRSDGAKRLVNRGEIKLDARKVKERWLKSLPYLIPCGVLALVLGLRLLPQGWSARNLFERLEGISYDWRVSYALKQPPPVDVATNLGAVYVAEGDLEYLNNRPERYYWPLPRFLHAQVTRHLADSGAKVVAFDILFLDRHPEGLLFVKSLGTTNTSDGHLAGQLALAGNVVLATSPTVFTNKGVRGIQGMPIPLLATNAVALGSISKTAVDQDGILRRVRAFEVTPGVGTNWNLGIVMAAVALGLDLDHPEFRPGSITLRSRDGKQTRTIPVQPDNTLLVDWYIPAPTPKYKYLPQLASFHSTNFVSALLGNQRSSGPATGATSPWKDRIVLIYSAGIGANLRDIGASPLEGAGTLAAAHWNVANSLLTNSFIRRSSPELDLLLIVCLTVVAGWVSWRIRALYSSLGILLIAAAYIWLGVHAYVKHRYWLPMVMPIGGALLMTHVVMVAYRAYVERAQQHQLESLFGKILAPDILKLLLRDERVSLATTRQEVGILFADIRGFTTFTDHQHDRALERIERDKLAPHQAQAVLDEVARETMDTVNHYLGLIAEQVKSHQGTLDKYIGDSVMAFWGAPTPTPTPVSRCVRAAIAIQRAVAATNAARREENASREKENLPRQQAGQPPLLPLHLFDVGVGINAGSAGVGFMGSQNHISNYTVFGREVNIASRVEGQAGGAQILITGATREALAKEDAALAARCRELPPIQVKGISRLVPVFDVPWRDDAAGQGPAPA